MSEQVTPTTEAPKKARKPKIDITTVPDPVLPVAPIPEEKAVVKEKPKKATKIVKADPILAANLEMIVPMAFVGIGAITKEPKLWTLQDDETRMLCDPMGRIITRLGASETVSKYGDGAALVMAAALIALPRILTMQAKGQKSNAKKASATNTRKPNQSPVQTSSDASSGTNVEKPTTSESRPNVKRGSGRSIKERAGDGVALD